MGWFAHVLGLDDASGPFYLAWSGFVGDLQEFAVVVLVWRRINCHARGCWRIGLHRVRDSHYQLCRRHHPDHDGVRAHTAQQIARSVKGADDQ